jgi:hypothetical protein
MMTPYGYSKVTIRLIVGSKMIIRFILLTGEEIVPLKHTCFQGNIPGFQGISGAEGVG